MLYVVIKSVILNGEINDEFGVFFTTNKWDAETKYEKLTESNRISHLRYSVQEIPLDTDVHYGM